jgi:hypothetical protein
MGGQIGPTEDLFSVYLGRTEDALKRGPLWRYARKDALKSPDMPAVAEFKKAVDPRAHKGVRGDLIRHHHIAARIQRKSADITGIAFVQVLDVRHS